MDLPYRYLTKDGVRMFSVKFHEKTETGRLVSIICECKIPNYITFQGTCIPFLNGVENDGTSEFLCSSCKRLLMTQKTLDTACRAYQLGDGGTEILALFFKSYGVKDISTAEVSETRIPVDIAGFPKPPKPENPTMQRLRKFYDSATKRIKVASKAALTTLKTSIEEQMANNKK